MALTALPCALRMSDATTIQAKQRGVSVSENNRIKKGGRVLLGRTENIYDMQLRDAIEVTGNRGHGSSMRNRENTLPFAYWAIAQAARVFSVCQHRGCDRGGSGHSANQIKQEERENNAAYSMSCIVNSTVMSLEMEAMGRAGR